MTAPSIFPRDLVTHFEQVVVPVDFSPLGWGVLTQAGRMARAFGVPEKLVHVDTSAPWADEGSSRVLTREAPSGQRVDVTVVAARTAADGILQVLGGDEGSLLVMSTHGHTAATELATGSTAEELLRRWHGPMLLAGPRHRSSPVPFRRIVLCVDPNSDAASPLLANDVVAWAHRFNISIEVLSIVDPVPTSHFEERIRQNERMEIAAAEVSTDERIAKLVRLESVWPGKAIARYVDAVEGTLVALPTHARRVPSRVVLGSTAFTVLRHATSPVLVRRFTAR
jgi:nucleotide-binding universal stress UspA family protein